MPFTRTLGEKPQAHEVRSALLEAGHYFAGLKSKPPADRGDGYKEDLQSVVEFIRDADLILTAVERGAQVIPDPGTGILGGPQAALGLGNPGGQSLGTLVAGNSDYQQFAARKGASSGFQDIEIRGSIFNHNDDWRAQQERATIVSNPQTGPGGGVWAPVGQPMPPNVRRMRLFLRDLIHVQGTNLHNIPYIREVNPTAYEYGASAVSENSAKPEVVLDWSLDNALVQKIAAWVPVTTEVIEDAPTLQGYIDGRLAYMVAIREEYEILNGSGTTPHLKGILQYTEKQTQTSGSDAIVRLGLAIGKVENVDGEADGIAMNPLDYWSMITARQSSHFDGDGLSGPGLPFTNANALGAWGLPVVRSRALTQNTAIVGSWSLGATLFDRQETVIRVGNQHSDFFTNNKVAILAEERVALAVHRPDFFVQVTLS